MRNAAGEIHDVDAATQVALGFGERLAVLARNELAELRKVFLEEGLVPEKDGCPVVDRSFLPFGKGLRRNAHRCVHVGGRRERGQGDDFAG